MRDKNLDKLIEAFTSDITDIDNISKALKLSGRLLSETEETDYNNTQLLLAMSFLKEYLRCSSSTVGISNALFEWMCARAYEVAHNLGKDVEVS